ncbi:MAG: helix-hairpin-helix domain-containing protein [Phycisphaerae bacterium]|nr:helix-hairpin-helix domain-containing protein [Phycisphaerae bacterium]
MNRGTVIVMVLVIVAMLSLAAVGQMLVVRSESSAAEASRDGQQARAAAMSGIHRAMAMLATEPNNYRACTDSPEIFKEQLVTGDAETGWKFTVFTGDISDPSGASVRYGIEDEAGKININIASAETIRALPGVTDELVDSLADYRPLATLEELLLVEGFTGPVVLGEDANLNGQLEPNEDDADETFPPDDGDGQLNRGLRPFANVISYEPNIDNEGNERININREKPDDLAEKLEEAGFGENIVKFIKAAREAKVKFTDPSQLLGMKLEVEDDRGSRPRGRRGGSGNGKKITIKSGVNADNLPLVMDKLTSGGTKRGKQEILEGRVNINSAPKEVLSALPGLEEDIAQQIVDSRGSLDEQTRSTTAWIYTQNIVSDKVFKKVSSLLTARSYQFRVRSFGYSLSCGRFCTLEAIIDTATGTPRIVYMRDLTRLGVPMKVTRASRP